MQNFNDEKYSLTMNEYINQIMIPTESLSAIFIDSSFEVPIKNLAKAELMHIGNVYSALTEFAKQQLISTMDKVSKETGEITIWHSRFTEYSLEDIDITVKYKASQHC